MTTGNGASDLLHELLSCPKDLIGQPTAGFGAWRKVWEKVENRWETPVDRSIFGGFLSDRLAWAFASGYQGAIRQLVPALPMDAIAAICVTESGGNHPRAIETRLTKDPSGKNYLLHGLKRFVTNGENADRLVVAGSTGMTDGKNRLRMAVVGSGAAGLTLRPMPPLPFVPELGHSEATFEGVSVPVDRLLPGDGYADYIKPFRTMEDLHVAGAVLGYLLGVGRRSGWPGKSAAQISALITLAAGLARQDLSAAQIHIAVDGLCGLLGKLTADLSPLWQQVAPEIKARWERDMPILKVARESRLIRLASAWKTFG